MIKLNESKAKRGSERQREETQKDRQTTKETEKQADRCMVLFKYSAVLYKKHVKKLQHRKILL